MDKDSRKYYLRLFMTKDARLSDCAKETLLEDYTSNIYREIEKSIAEYINSDDELYDEEIVVNANTIKRMMTKQNKMKPLEVKYGKVIYKFRCPNCDFLYSRNKMGIIKNKYCRECGQALDWTDYEEASQ